MANAVPMLEGTSASGGYLVRDAFGPTLQTAIARESAVFDLSQKQYINTNKERFAVYAGRPTAAFVAEAAAKGVSGAEFTEMAVNVKKIATIVMYTDELLEDAAVDPTNLVNADVGAAFADLYDAHALGRTASGVLSSSFDVGLTTTTQTVELGAGGDALAVAISNAMEKVEANGYSPSGIVLARDARAQFRNARETVETATPLYQNFFGAGSPTDIYGIPLRYSSNLQTIGGTAGSARVVGIVGDFSQAYFVVRRSLTMSATNLATIDVSGTLHHLWQQNKTAMRWESRIGFNAADLNRAFCTITNVS